MSGPEPSITQEDIDTICLHLAKGNYRETAYALVGRQKQVVRSWCRRGVRERAAGVDSLCARFVSAMEEAEAHAEEDLVGKIREAGTEDFEKSNGEKGITMERFDWKASAWILERRGQKNWGVKKQIQITLSDAVDRLLTVAEEVLSAEDFERLRDALEREELAQGSGNPEEIGTPEED